VYKFVQNVLVGKNSVWSGCIVFYRMLYIPLKWTDLCTACYKSHHWRFYGGRNWVHQAASRGYLESGW